MAKVKNSFLKSKMNKDLDDRLIPNGEYRDAVNITVNNSDGEDVGTAQTVRGNLEVIDFFQVTSVVGLEVIGILDDEFSSTVFVFLTNNDETDYDRLSYSAIVSWNVNEATTSAKIIVEGNWLNFSKSNPVTANLLEDLLFFTDNRNQPRKVNINYKPGYYTNEDQISVAKYYPYQTIELYQGSQVTGAEVLNTTATSSTTDANTVVCADVSGLSVGDALISGGNGVPYNTFVIGIDVPSLTVTLSQNVTIASSQALVFSSAETTMKDAISEYLPPTGQGEVNNIASTTVFTLEDYKGYIAASSTVVGGVGFSVFKKVGFNWVDTGALVTAVDKDIVNGGIEFTTDIASGVILTDDVLIAIPNPYYDSAFAGTANVDYLEDKFVRFSYRFKFDDGEYSLIAPFTQPCFIPKQDGYFLTPLSITGEDIEISDEKRAYQSTEVSFMENKVNKINLNIPLPYTAGTMQSKLKIQEIDILYKESNEIAIKVVDSIPAQGNFSGNDYYFQYEYGSKSPYKSLPEKENTRVYDKVPVKAQSQEIISNRVVYGNYQDKHMPPSFLDYNVAATEKYSFGVGIANIGTSEIEYPNATLKQNRNYEVGVVLADRFGRQSTVVLSESEFNNMPSYLASTIYNEFRGEDQQSVASTFDGDSLKVTFNNLIPSSYNNGPGLYNGDQNSDNYNPLGWYSFKIVVKQQQQDYYNAYVAPIMKGYPTDVEKEKFETSHISLFGDNINKIPRDLAELGPTQKQFRSSVKLWPRVAGDASLTGVSGFYNTIQFFPERVGDIASAIGTIDDLFDLPNDPGELLGDLTALDIKATTTNTVRFQLSNPSDPDEVALCLGMKNGDEIRGVNYGTKDTIITEIISDQTTPPAAGSVWEVTFSDAPQGTVGGNNISFHRPGGRNYFYNQESDPLIARISTTKQAGLGIPNPYPTRGGGLNIYEVEAQESLLDIYWETSTNGLISELNQAIADGPGALLYDRVEGFNDVLTEATNTGDALSGIVVAGFKAVLLNGQSITPVADSEATLLSVYEQGVPANTTNLLGNPYEDSFNIVSNLDGSFNLVIVDPSELAVTTANNNLTFEIEYNHPNADTSLIDLKNIDLGNVNPSIDTCPAGDITITNPKSVAPIYSFTGVNGSFTTSLNQLDLVWSLTGSTNIVYFSIDQNGVLTANQLDTPAGTYPIEVTLSDGGGEQAVCNFNVIYSYTPTAVWSPSGDESVNVNNTDYPLGGNILPVTQTGTLTITNSGAAGFDVFMRSQHEGTTSSAWSTSFNATVGVQSFTDGILNLSSPRVQDTSVTNFADGVYSFSITVDVNNLPPLTSGTAQSLGTLIAQVP
jgi:hypothetical protein